VADLSMSHDEGRPTIAEARRFVVDRLNGWDVPDPVVRDLVLITSELVTNAVVHGGSPVELRLERTGSRVVVLVEDDAVGRLPQAQRPSDDDEHGRGLHIVEALSDEWGMRETDRGKCVWSARAWRPAVEGGS
jgi:anti-sigma regulatory factor (Ser/Thr protein kinase)